MNLLKAIWIALGFLWVIAASGSKTTERRENSASRFAHGTLLAAAFLVIAEGWRFDVLAMRFLPDSASVYWAGIAITLAGAAIAVWARLTIGSNWSGRVTIKQNHELIRTGPYALVRHPIYTGLLLALAGTAVAMGEVRGLVALALSVIAFRWKAAIEESFMIARFGDEYVRYRREVKALIPFVL